MMKDQSQSRLHFGKAMEEKALEWFKARHSDCRLLARNYLIRGGELDLVLEDAGELVFVEVRARLPGSIQSGLESVTLPKQLRLRRAIRHFLARYQGPARSARFDILAWDGSQWSHYPDVWLPD